MLISGSSVARHCAQIPGGLVTGLAASHWSFVREVLEGGIVAVTSPCLPAGAFRSVETSEPPSLLDKLLFFETSAGFVATLRESSCCADFIVLPTFRRFETSGSEGGLLSPGKYAAQVSSKRDRT